MHMVRWTVPPDPPTLLALLEYLREASAEVYDWWTACPTYGGEPPSTTEGVWSWDRESVLIGYSRDTLQVLSREVYESRYGAR